MAHAVVQGIYLMPWGVLMTAPFTLSVRSSRLLAYLLKNPVFLLSDESCLPELYRNVIMGKGVFTGLKDTSSSSRNTATTEQKFWSTGALVDSILVPCWERPDELLNPLLRAQTEVDVAHDLVAVSKFKGCSVFSHTLEYFHLLQEGSLATFGFGLFNFKPDRQELNMHIRLGAKADIFMKCVDTRPTRAVDRVQHTIHDVVAK